MESDMFEVDLDTVDLLLYWQIQSALKHIGLNAAQETFGVSRKLDCYK